MRTLVATALSLTLLVSGSLAAQPNPATYMLGAWSGQEAGQGGMVHRTTEYAPDGSFVSVTQLPNGTMQRIWGSYQAAPLSSGQLRIDFQVQGWLPKQICAQAPGFPVQCRLNRVPQTGSTTVDLTSGSSFRANGVSMMRDNAPYLLQHQVPEQLVLAAPAPVQPNIRQPVMPTLHPYVTPNGPGNAIAGANHAGAQNFVNGYMRGCYKGDDGRLYGCQQ